MSPVNLFWFRRDLRLHDNAGLYHALKSGQAVQPIFIFDTTILNALKNKQDNRVAFIHQALSELQNELTALGATLDVRYGEPLAVFNELCNNYNVDEVYANRDYEPYARERDKAVYDFLREQGIAFRAFKDHVIFEKSQVVKPNGTPYTVFTPYARKWQSLFSTQDTEPYPTRLCAERFYQQPARVLLSLSDIGFQAATIEFPPCRIDSELLHHYLQQRDFPPLVVRLD